MLRASWSPVYRAAAVNPVWSTMRADRGGFRLGPATEATRLSSETLRWVLRPDGCSDVVAHLMTVSPQPWEAVGAVVRLEEVLPRVRAPWGEDATAFPEAVRVSSTASPRREGKAPMDPRLIPITVVVEHPEAERLEFRFTLAELPLAERWLTRKVAGAGDDR